MKIRRGRQIHCHAKVDCEGDSKEWTYHRQGNDPVMQYTDKRQKVSITGKRISHRVTNN